MSKIQYRAICPICFKQHAVKGDRMVDHGYTIQQDWHQRNGSCEGYREPHFGTVAGRVVTEKHIEYIVGYVARLKATPTPRTFTVKKYEFSPRGSEKAKEMITLTEHDGHRFHEERREYQYRIGRQIDAANNAITFLKDRVSKWEPADPVKVEKENTGPLMHAARQNSRLSSVLCVYNERQSFRPVYRQSTDDHSKVNCKRCLAEIARLAAKS